MLRRITSRLLEERVAVIECGYMNSASAEPRARVAYVHWPASAGTREPRGLPVAGFVWLNASPALAKMSSNPPSLIGM